MQEMHCQLQSDRLLADRLITHPNVLTVLNCIGLCPMLSMLKATVSTSLQHGGGLRPVHQNRVGLILDQGIEPDLCCDNFKQLMQQELHWG